MPARLPAGCARAGIASSCFPLMHSEGGSPNDWTVLSLFFQRLGDGQSVPVTGPRLDRGVAVTLPIFHSLSALCSRNSQSCCDVTGS